jgi:hypothetical protein
MFFLLRMAFWLGLVLVLLPTDRSPEPDQGAQIGASEAISAATAAVSDMSQFCNRQPAACTVGGQAATVIGERAQSGAKKVYQFITDKADKNDKKAPDPTDKANKKSPDHTGSIGAPDDTDADKFQTTGVVHQTLSQDDLAIDWQPPVPGSTSGP